jgi:hypothetical protein
MLFRLGGSLCILLVGNTQNAGSHFVVDDGRVVFVNSKFLISSGWPVKLYDVGSGWERLTTMSSDFNSNGSNSRP